MDLGLYESLVTDSLSAQLKNGGSGRPAFASVDPADQPHVLARHIYEVAQRVLAGTRDEAVRIDVVNRLLVELGAAEDQVSPPAAQLLRMLRPLNLG